MRLPVTLLLTLWVTGCSPPDACDALCPVAGDAFELCLDEWGLSWGSGVGYEDRADYDSWCSTWVLEQRTLAETSEAPQSAEHDLETRCEEQTASLQAGDCSQYWSTWSD